MVDRVAMVEADRVGVAPRAVLLDEHNREIDDITEYLEDGVIEHNNLETVHRTISMSISTALEWGRHRVQMYTRITGAGETEEVPQGVFCLTVPERPRALLPAVYSVQGHDLLYLLDGLTDRTLYFDTTTPVLTHVRNLLAELGFPSDLIDNTLASETLSSPMQIPITDDRTWLTVINDLLASIAYHGLSMTFDGKPTSRPYLAAVDRSPVWTYDATKRLTRTITDEGVLIHDYTNAYNSWIFYISSPDDEVHVEGNGLYRWRNDSNGPSSVSARGGHVRVRKEAVEAASHAILVSIANRKITEDMHIPRRLTMTTGPNPYHGHFDVVTANDPAGGVAGKWQQVSYTLPLFGEDMEHELRSVT